MCSDRRCTDGITACMGDNGCNGWGVLTPRGRTYKQKRATAPTYPWAVAHHECNGTGRRACGCRTLTPEQRASLRGRPWGKSADGKPEQRWSSYQCRLIDKPKRARKPNLARVESIKPAA